ncbi:hypothetical protein FAGAP_10990 [Fusarium agapanthi]|uniref:Uncharacterized protein n=1 Tax=Fusarium agapanthi TaxID=1803897 RepID=A0A9P5E3S0_9HYPO|nr:hypothetical protein FAGAP_10990 [Fusarium agapanthi]
MASPSTLMTVISPTTTLHVPAQHYDGKPSHSDKLVIIGLTVGMAVGWIREIEVVWGWFPLGKSSPYLASQLTSQSTTTMTNTIRRRMSDTSVVIAIAISCTAIVVIFLAAVCVCNWRSRPRSPTGNRGRDQDDSDANSDIELDAMPDGALNHPLVRGSNGAGHVYPVFEATREHHAQN